MSTPKPWEQEWAVDHDYAVLCEQRKVRARVYTDELTREEAKADAKLIAAAPDMARALLAVLETYGDDSGRAALEFAREALRKAGVLP